jgi:biotin transport system substrate-specific component
VFDRPFSRTRGLALSATFAALVSITGPISIPLPITPVPFTLQVFMVYLTSMVVGPFYGALSLTIYLLVGSLGLPVFAGASSGPLALVAPTGGYLLAFPLAALLGGLVASRRSSSRNRDVVRLAASALVTLAVIYTIGVIGLSLSLGVGLYSATIIGAVPFVPLDLAKAAVAVPMAAGIRWSNLQLPIRSKGKATEIRVA